MTQSQQKLQKLFETLEKIDTLFQYPEDLTRYVGQCSKSEGDADIFLSKIEQHNIDVDDHIEDLKNELLEWELRFKADPLLKQSYIALGKRLKIYRERFDQPQYRGLKDRIEKAGFLKPLIEPLEIKRLRDIKEDEIDSYRIEIEYQFLAREAVADRRAIGNLEQIKINLRHAVECDKKVRAGYDDFLCNKLILAHMDNDAQDVNVFNIPYNKLTSFVKATEPYIG